ncbi:hypothetical protein GEMRC1_004542 [Eukaryota sp. GEM-RC1]
MVLEFPRTTPKIHTCTVEEGRTVLTHQSNSSGQDPICIKSVLPITWVLPLTYFEITVVSRGSKSRYCCTVGLVSSTYSLNRPLGWDINSIAYHADDGMVYHESCTGSNFGFPHANVGDTIGLCFVASHQKVVFTYNGIILPKAFSVNLGSVHAALGLRYHGESLMVRTCEPFLTPKSQLLTHFELSNGSNPLPYLDSRLVVPNMIDLFPRSSPKVQTCVLEEGRTVFTHQLNNSDHDLICIKSVLPITSTFPITYFELTVLSLGSKSRYGCVIGLVDSTYPSHRLPGWDPNSIAYHGDNGMICQESGSGTNFGFPNANVGDTIGLCYVPCHQKVLFTYNG